MAYSRKTFPVEIREEGKEKRDGKIKRSRNTNFTIRGNIFFFIFIQGGGLSFPSFFPILF